MIESDLDESPMPDERFPENRKNISDKAGAILAKNLYES